MNSRNKSKKPFGWQQEIIGIRPTILKHLDLHEYHFCHYDIVDKLTITNDICSYSDKDFSDILQISKSRVKQCLEYLHSNAIFGFSKCSDGYFVDYNHKACFTYKGVRYTEIPEIGYVYKLSPKVRADYGFTMKQYALLYAIAVERHFEKKVFGAMNIYEIASAVRVSRGRVHNLVTEFLWSGILSTKTTLNDVSINCPDLLKDLEHVYLSEIS
jgi:hypothetical protein